MKHTEQSRVFLCHFLTRQEPPQGAGNPCTTLNILSSLRGHNSKASTLH